MSVCRSCGAEVEWQRTEKGKAIPLDVGSTPGGNLRVERGVVRYVPSGTGNRVAHFATCPNAAQHRKPHQEGDQ